MNARETAVQYLPSDQVRDTLGSRMAWIRDTGGILIVTADGAPDGALVPPGLLDAAGLTLVSEQGVRAARAQWGAIRARAAAEGPQGLTLHKSLLAVLVDQPTATALAKGVPVLAFSELTVTGAGVVLSDGEPVTPGTYALRDGKVVHIDSPAERKWDMSLHEDMLDDEDTPDTVIRNVLDDTAAHVAGALMRRARTTQDPRAKEEATGRMRQVWRLTTASHMERTEMVDHIRDLRQQMTDLDEA